MKGPVRYVALCRDFVGAARVKKADAERDAQKWDAMGNCDHTHVVEEATLHTNGKWRTTSGRTVER